MLGGAELVEVSSDGEPGDKSRFVRGVERALLDGRGGDRRPLGQGPARREMPEGLAIAAVPAREDPADVWIGVGASLEDVARGRPGRHREPAPPRAAARRAAGPAGRGAARQRRHPPAQARPRASSTRSSSPPPACAGSAARARSASRSRSTRWSRPPGRARWCCRSAPTTRRRARPRRGDQRRARRCAS